jgi:hypothetical protein
MDAPESSTVKQENAATDTTASNDNNSNNSVEQELFQVRNDLVEQLRLLQQRLSAVRPPPPTLSDSDTFSPEANELIQILCSLVQLVEPLRVPLLSYANVSQQQPAPALALPASDTAAAATANPSSGNSRLAILQSNLAFAQRKRPRLPDEEAPEK